MWWACRLRLGIVLAVLLLAVAPVLAGLVSEGWPPPVVPEPETEAFATLFARFRLLPYDSIFSKRGG